MTDRDRVFIYCDSERHAPRRVPVREFEYVESDAASGWIDRTKRSRRKGASVVNNQRARTGWALDPNTPNSAHHTTETLMCAVCGPRGTGKVDLQQAALRGYLDALRELGQPEVPLRLVAAMVGRAGT